MGIRYDKDNRRATNGPMIFFSIAKDEAFEEEIRGAYNTGLSFYVYRFPGESMMCYGSSEGCIEGLGTPGFVIGMFDPSLPVITIPFKGTKSSDEILSYYNMPAESTSFKDYSNEVEGIIRALKEGKGKKVVAARAIVRHTDFDIADKYYQLCQRFPEAFVFCFSTPVTGCWIGASPELLLEGNQSCLNSTALAGTRLSGNQEPWDAKNIEEQKIVSEYINEIFLKGGLKPEEGLTFTKSAGKIEHICTPVSAVLPENFSESDLGALLRNLSPTPALCGCPKSFSLSAISKYEKFQRGCYGGFCGPYRSVSDFSLNVVVRCASVTEKKYCVYAGGGITALSNVSSEWEETEIKASTVFPPEDTSETIDFSRMS